MTEERLRQIINDAHKKGEIGLLIWKNSEERDKLGGNEEEMFVEKAFEPHGYRQDGTAYGDYRNMELSRAIRNYFEMGCPFRLVTETSEFPVAMTFKIEDLLSIEGHFLFTYRMLKYKHLNGPILLFPSYQMVE